MRCVATKSFSRFTPRRFRPTHRRRPAKLFAAIGLSCLKQKLLNQEALINGEAEGIHQMRAE
jgi:hypothetical protein